MFRNVLGKFPTRLISVALLGVLQRHKADNLFLARIAEQRTLASRIMDPVADNR